MLKKLTKHIFYLPHEPEVDRPLLAYIKGGRFSLAVDAGYSPKHTGIFYRDLEQAAFPAPDFTVLTHWHYDHTFGLCRTRGVSIAHEQTREFLAAEQEKARAAGYFARMKEEDPCFAREYAGETGVTVTLPDLCFSHTLSLDLGELTARIFHTMSPHSPDTVCVYIPQERVLFLGDATSEDFFNHGYLDKDKLKDLTRTIESIDCGLCVLSHAEPMEKADLLDYLNSVLKD